MKNNSRPYSCHYFASKKAWMTSKIFEGILVQLDKRMKRENRSQPPDVGIIKQWKVKAKRILLRYVCSKVDGKTTASEIAKSIHLLMSMQWGK